MFSREGYAIPSDAQAWILGSATTGIYINQATQDFTNYFGSNVETKINLYANWQEKELRVYFYPNGGTAKSGHELITTSGDAHVGASKTYNTVKYSNASNFNLYNCTTLFSRTGYSVPSDAQAWRKDSATSITYISQAGADLTSYFGSDVVSSIKLYAHWTANEYKVTLDSNGGNYNGVEFNVTYGARYNPLNNFIPTKTGYVFDGWYTAASGGTNITASSTVSTASNHTLYAHWTEKHILITYYSNGATKVGSEETAGLSSDKTKSTKTTTVRWTNRTGVNLWNCTSLFSRPGYHTPSNATAWRLGASNSTIYINQASQDFTNYFGDGVETKIKLYANWEAHTYGAYEYYDNTYHRKTCTVCGVTASAKHTAGASCGSKYLIIGKLKSETSERYIYKSKCKNYSNCGGTVDYYRKKTDGKLSTGTEMKYSKFIDANGNLVGEESCPRRKCTVCSGWYTP